MKNHPGLKEKIALWLFLLEVIEVEELAGEGGMPSAFELRCAPNAPW